MKTGYSVREGAELLLARLLRDPANWPSIQEDSEALRHRICPEDPSVYPSSSDGFPSEPDAAVINPTAASSGQLEAA